MRIYGIATTATSLSGTDVVMADSGASGSSKQITYANLCLNQPAISTTGSITAASLTATSATIGSLDTTLARDYINAYVSATGAITASSAASAATVIGGTWTSITATSDFSVSGTGKVTHVGTDSSLYFVNANISITRASATTANAVFQIWKTGGLIAGAQTPRYFSGMDTGALSISTLVTLGENDYLEVRMSDDDGSLGYTTQVGTSINVIEMT